MSRVYLIYYQYIKIELNLTWYLNEKPLHHRFSYFDFCDFIYRTRKSINFWSINSYFDCVLFLSQLVCLKGRREKNKLSWCLATFVFSFTTCCLVCHWFFPKKDGHITKQLQLCQVLHIQLLLTLRLQSNIPDFVY